MYLGVEVAALGDFWGAEGHPEASTIMKINYPGSLVAPKWSRGHALWEPPGSQRVENAARGGHF